MGMRAAGMPAGVRESVRKDGSVVFRARWTTADGRRITATCETLDEAERLAAGAAVETPGPQTFAEVARQWQSQRSRRANTRASESSTLRNHLLPAFGEMPIALITEGDVSKWMQRLQRSGTSASTIRKLRQILGMVFSSAIIDGIVDKNPVTAVKAPYHRRGERRFFTLPELQSLNEAFDPFYALTLAFLLATGVRIGELCALNVGDVYLEFADCEMPVRLDEAGQSGHGAPAGGLVSVSRSLAEVSPEMSDEQRWATTGPVKTDAGRRVIPTISAQLAHELLTHVRDRGAARDSPLFTGRQGARLTPSNWRSRVWRPAVAQADLRSPQPTPHALRHTAVSLWLEAGFDPLHVARWLGHRSVQTVLDIYGHVQPDDWASRREAVNRIRTLPFGLANRTETRDAGM